MMFKHPIYESPEERRRRLVEEFRARYPHPFFAWAERESPFWTPMLDNHMSPRDKAMLVTWAYAGRSFRVPKKMNEMWDCYFRAAWWCLVPKEKKGRGWDDFSAVVLARAFKLEGRYERLIAAERRWQRRQALRPKTKEIESQGPAEYKPQFPDLMPTLAGLPSVDELFDALLVLPSKK
jgi:hypothetical protein